MTTSNSVVRHYLLAHVPKLEKDDELGSSSSFTSTKTIEEHDNDACVIVLFATKDYKTISFK